MRNPGRAGVGVGVGVVDVDDVCGGKADCAAAGMEGEGARDMLPERSAVWALCMCGGDGLPLAVLCAPCLYSSLFSSFLPRSFCQMHTILQLIPKLERVQNKYPYMQLRNRCQMSP